MTKQKNFDRLPPVKRGPVYLLDSLLGLGVGFRIDGDKLVALGDGASPVLQALVDRHAAQLIPMLPAAGVMARIITNGLPTRATTGKPDNLSPGDNDRMQLIRNGIEGAEKQAAKKKAIAIARARRKAYV